MCGCVIVCVSGCVCVCVCVSVHVRVYVCGRLPVWLSACLPACMPVCPSVGVSNLPGYLHGLGLPGTAHPGTRAYEHTGIRTDSPTHPHKQHTCIYTSMAACMYVCLRDNYSVYRCVRCVWGVVCLCGCVCVCVCVCQCVCVFSWVPVLVCICVCVCVCVCVGVCRSPDLLDCLSAYWSVRMGVWHSVSQPICQCANQSVCLSVCLCGSGGTHVHLCVHLAVSLCV